MVTICFLVLSLDIILVCEILKYRYTACIPSCLDNEDVFMIACIDTSSLRRSSLRVMHGRGHGQAFYGSVHIILWVWFPVCPLYSYIFGGNYFCIEVTLGVRFCPLSGIKKRPLLGGCFSITTMLVSIRNTELVRCREVVRFSEGPLSEARLYI